jgi:hypothetical protein
MKKTLIISAFALFFLTKIQAQTSNKSMEAPQLEFVCELKVFVTAPMIVGETARGIRRVIPISGGTFEGPKMKGEVINGGADWQIVRKDGVAELEAHYTIKTDDGTYIYVKNVGLRVATPEVAARIGRGEQVGSNEYYFRAVPKFEAPTGKYEWLNNAIFVCKGIRNPDNVTIQVWKIL